MMKTQVLDLTGRAVCSEVDHINTSYPWCWMDWKINTLAWLKKWNNQIWQPSRWNLRFSSRFHTCFWILRVHEAFAFVTNQSLLLWKSYWVWKTEAKGWLMNVSVYWMIYVTACKPQGGTEDNRKWIERREEFDKTFNILQPKSRKKDSSRV